MAGHFSHTSTSPPTTNLWFSAVAKLKKESYYHAKNVILIKYEGISQRKCDWLGIQRKECGKDNFTFLPHAYQMPGYNEVNY